MAVPILIISLLGGITQTVTGFGSGIVTMMVFPYFLGITAAPAVSSLASLVLSVSIAFQYRKHIRFRKVLLPAAFYVFFSVLIVNIVQSLKTDALAVSLGIFLITLSLYFLFFQDKMKFKLTTPLLIGFAIFSGVFSGLFGIGGPLMAISFLELTDSHEEYLASLQFLFSIGGVITAIARIRVGILTPAHIPAVLLGAAGILLGKYLGGRISSRLNAELLKKIIYVFVGISGIVTVVQYI